MKSPFPWLGSKRRLAKQILARFPHDHRCYVEPCAGTAALLLAREQPAELEVINDVDFEVVNLFRVVKHHLLELCNQFRWALVSRQLFEWTESTPPDTLTDIQRAARFLYLQKLAFGGRAIGRTFGVVTESRPRLNLARLEEDLSDLHARLASVVVENLPWKACMDRYDRPHTLFFVDPPYHDLTGYPAGRWELQQYEELADVLRSLKGRALLTINDHPEMRRVFAGFDLDELLVRYTVNGGSGSMTTELLIRTWS